MQERTIEKFWLHAFYGFAALMLVFGFLSIYLENYVLMVIPPMVLFLYLSINDFKFVYFLLIITIPLSVEVALPGGFSTDFPTELLIVGLMFLFLAWFLAKPEMFDAQFFRSPIIILLAAHYFWIICTTLFSSDVYVSLKFTLAKTWYLVTFVLGTAIIVKNVSAFKTFFWCFLIPLLLAIIYTLIRHSRFDFSFETVNDQMHPFFRNHVNYACTLAEMVPFVILALTWYKRKTFKRSFLIFSLLLILVAIYFAYTRSAWLSLLVAIVFYFVVRQKWMAWILGTSLVGVVAFFLYMGANNHYLNYEPNYEHTIYHPELEEHLISTFHGEDVSSAERIYRWVAGVRMWMAKPFIGYGPGNFYNFYKSYTVNGFETYVSANPERSSIHNYFLLVLTEQGIIGLIIFLALTITLLVKGQQIYHETLSKEEKRYVMAVLLCLVIIHVNTFLSDLIETDKIGSMYFICIALLVNQDLKNQKDLNLGRAEMPITRP